MLKQREFEKVTKTSTWFQLNFCYCTDHDVNFFLSKSRTIFAIDLYFIHCFGVVVFLFVCFALLLLFLSTFEFSFYLAAMFFRWWFSSCVEESWGWHVQWQEFGNGYCLASSVWDASVHSRYARASVWTRGEELLDSVMRENSMSFKFRVFFLYIIWFC